MTTLDVLLLALGLMAVGSAVLVVTTRQLVHAALWLVVTLGSLAASYLLLTAEFLAWVQLLIYVGAVVVLLVFALMLTKAPIGRADDLDTRNRPLALVVAVGTAATLVTLVVQAFRTERVDLGHGSAVQPGTATALGSAVFQSWVLPFELLSVLLLAALVGAIVLSRRRQDSSSGQDL